MNPPRWTMRPSRSKVPAQWSSLNSLLPLPPTSTKWSNQNPIQKQFRKKAIGMSGQFIAR
jgi:hypothetical protein